MSKLRIRSTVAGAVGALALLLAASPALGEEQTRETYKAQVEPICKTNSEASDRILNGVKGKVKADKLDAAAASFTKAASSLKKTLNQLKAVPQPTADQAKLAKWLGYIKTEVELFEKTAKKLKSGDKDGAVAMTIDLTRTGNLANSQVLAFGFKYCKVDTAQYS